jgi:ankyrin repeat protein
MLLQAGANPEIRDNYGSTALHLAVQKSKLCVRELLRGGADPDVPVFHIENFHLSSSLEPSCEAISLLIAYGADVNDRTNRNNTTMLGRAASKDRFDSCDSCKYLLMHGGDINHVDIDGDTPLSETIRKNRHKDLKFLLSKNSGYHHVNKDRQTVLHIAATAGDIETLQILAAASLTGLDPGAQDCRGWTASQTFEKRLGVSDATKDAFRTLIESVNEADKMIRREEDGDISRDEGEEFFDALETCDD